MKPTGVRIRRPARSPGAPSGRRGRAMRLLKWALVALAGYYVLALLLLVVYRFLPPPTTGVQVQRRVEALLTGRDYAKTREWVDIDDLPERVPRAVVAAEDGRFWSHHGFDWEEMLDARDGRVEHVGAAEE